MPVKPKNFDHFLEVGCGRCSLGGTPDCRVVPYRRLLESVQLLVLEAGLKEKIKWSVPCYTDRGRNVVTLAALKRGVIVSFFRGAELCDSAGLLEKPGENSRSGRYFIIEDMEMFEERRQDLTRYLTEAIELERQGRAVKSSSPEEMKYPDELIDIFDQQPDLKDAFGRLTPGRRRGYLLHFTAAKQPSTRINRIAKCRDRILAGKGLNERS